MFPSLGLPSSETRASSGLSAGALFAEHSQGLEVCAVDGGDIAFPRIVSLLSAEATLELPLAQSPFLVVWMGRVHLPHLVAMA